MFGSIVLAIRNPPTTRTTYDELIQGLYYAEFRCATFTKVLIIILSYYHVLVKNAANLKTVTLNIAISTHLHDSVNPMRIQNI